MGKLIFQSPTANDPLLDLNTQPSLDLQFATSKTLNDRVSGQNLITFSRSTTGTYVDSNGIIQTAAIDAPRFDHDPTTGESLGLLIEESRENLLQYSERFDESVWIVQNSPILAPSSDTAPDGSLTAWDYTRISGASNTIYQRVTVDTSKTYTYSMYVRAKSGTVDFQLVAFDTASRTSSVFTVGTEWQRFSFTLQPAASTTNFYLADPESNSFNTAFNVWGAQLEAGAFPTSYIPTSGSTETRAADVASITGTNFSSWYNPDDSTVYWEGNLIGDAVGQYALFAIQQPGTRINGILFTRRSNNGSRFNHYDSSDLGDIDFNGPLWIDNSYRKLSGAIGQSSAGFADSGSLIGTDSTYQRPSASDGLDRLLLGSGVGGGVSPYNVHISRLTYYPYRLPDATLQEITS